MAKPNSDIQSADSSIASLHKKKKRVALYIRVSSEEQASGGFSLAFQEEMLRQYIELASQMHGYNAEGAELFSDVSSGGNMNRPGLKSLMKRVNSKRA